LPSELDECERIVPTPPDAPPSEPWPPWYLEEEGRQKRKRKKGKKKEMPAEAPPNHRKTAAMLSQEGKGTCPTQVALYAKVQKPRRTATTTSVEP